MTKTNISAKKGATKKKDDVSVLHKFPFKTQWDFSKIYKSEKDPQIEKDVELIEQKFQAFSKKYSNKKFLNSPKTIFTAL
ncbi:MAG: hypothetical protein WCO09_00390, partial [bacterium]